MSKNLDQNNQIEELKERYDLVTQRIAQILNEETVKEPYLDYFKTTANFVMQIKALASELELNKEMPSLEVCKQKNYELYQDIIGENYKTSYANPDYAVAKLDERIGKQLSFVYTELRGSIVYAYEKRLFDLTILFELYMEIYNLFEQEMEEEELSSAIHSAIYYYISDYSDTTIAYRVREMIDPSLSFATDIIMNSDLSDLRYLYQFGEYITENELKIAEYLNSLPQEKIDDMARNYTSAFELGFINSRIDLSKKSAVNIRYSVGFERMVRAAIKQFEEMGLKVTIYRAAVASINKKQHLKIGYFSTVANKQYEYDHRFDDALYLDRALVERKLVNLRVAYERYKELASGYAGPAVIEIFGEKPFEPVQSIHANTLDEKQQKLTVKYQTESALILEEYIPSDQFSFTIIAYPIPDIGVDFEAIFDETVKVNTLDVNQYRIIQQSLIDALDEGEYVHVLGSGKNKTDLKVMLAPLKDKSKETNFENCLADVNVPVGEVFTSPRLVGTIGKLHVTEVYLNKLKYIDLELDFKDGMIVNYTCKNFDNEDENKRFVKENLMFHRETLPIGEFAIGTNTTAYMMARKYNISHLLPILIAEKTGPHFAVGDTCFKRSEDLKRYNPDGKEVVARDNECSILRKTDMEQAYFNCHTDITIPYNELKDISVYSKEGVKNTIIKDGRFVLKGTEELNDAFNE